MKFLLFENYGQEVGGPVYSWSPNLKVWWNQSPPVTTVVEPMSRKLCQMYNRRPQSKTVMPVFTNGTPHSEQQFLHRRALLDSGKLKRTGPTFVNTVVLLQSACTIGYGWWRGTVAERWSLAGELSLSCARPVAD